MATVFQIYWRGTQNLMKLVKTFIEDLYIIENSKYKDNRGWFLESYKKKFFENENIYINFIQDNHSLSFKKGVLRGLHCQIAPKEQTKLVRCVKGKIWDVAVDIRKKSKTYLKWLGVELSQNNNKMLLIPKGFLHGFLTLEDESEVLYKVDNYYSKKHDRSVNYKDESLKIQWPLKSFILSSKDQNAKKLFDQDIEF
jgi:dTDP-4-dehydrorhamnose 3,5-epimerase